MTAAILVTFSHRAGPALSFGIILITSHHSVHDPLSMRYGFFWIVAALFFLYIQCKLSVLVVGLLPGFTSVEHSGSAHLPDDIRDSGFSILPVTPYRLPDLHLAVAVLLTIFSRNNAKSPKHISMAHHVLYFMFVTLVFCYQYNLFTTYPTVDPSVLILLKAPFHEQSLFAHTNEFHISTHAIFMTLIILCWRFYQPAFQSDSRRPCLYVAWFLGVASIISSRVEFTQDVGRGCCFAVIAFYSYFFMVTPENNEKQQQLQGSGIARRNPRRSSQDRAQSTQASAAIFPVCYKPDGEITRLRDLYLDLMCFAITNTIYMDPPVVLFTATKPLQFLSDRKFSLEARDHGLDLPTCILGRCGRKRLQTIRSCIELILSRAVPGDMIDIGVWRGGEIAYMKAVLLAFDAKNRHVIGIGHFRGPVFLSDRLQFFLRVLSALLPMILFENILRILSMIIPGVKTFPIASNDKGPDAAWNEYRLKHPDIFLKSTLHTDLQSVKSMLQRYCLLDESVMLLSGMIPHVLSNIQFRTFALFRIATGVSHYELLEALRCLYPQLSCGGVVMIDDYFQSKSAVDCFRAERNCKDVLIWADRQCVYWHKSS